MYDWIRNIEQYGRPYLYHQYQLYNETNITGQTMFTNDTMLTSAYLLILIIPNWCTEELSGKLTILYTLTVFDISLINFITDLPPDHKFIVTLHSHEFTFSSSYPWWWNRLLPLGWLCACGWSGGWWAQREELQVLCPEVVVEERHHKYSKERHQAKFSACGS